MNNLLSLDFSTEGIQFIDGHILYRVEAFYRGGAKHTMYMTKEAFEALASATNLCIRTGEYKEAKPFIIGKVYEFQPLDPVTFCKEDFGQ